jgi:alpha-aminoadipate/glutamate carrier protein LysW
LFARGKIIETPTVKDCQGGHGIRRNKNPAVSPPAPLTLGEEESKYYQGASRGYPSSIEWSEEIMVLCPECETNLDVEEEEVDEGEIVSCPECGTDFEVVTTNPLELKPMEEGYLEEEEEVETEDGDDS